MSKLETLLDSQLKALRLADYEREYRFAAHHVGMGNGVRERLKAAGLKDNRFDFAWPNQMFAVEVEGGGWTGGRHTRGKGFADDLRKYHNAQKLGWTIYRCDGALIRNGDAVQLIEDMLKVIDGRR